jgi:hypothetical protein
MDASEKELKAAIAVALRRVEAGDLTAEDFDNIAKLLDAVLPDDAIDVAAPISVSDAVSEIVRKRSGGHE